MVELALAFLVGLVLGTAATLALVAVVVSRAATALTVAPASSQRALEASAPTTELVSQALARTAQVAHQVSSSSSRDQEQADTWSQIAHAARVRENLRRHNAAAERVPCTWCQNARNALKRLLPGQVSRATQGQNAAENKKLG